MTIETTYNIRDEVQHKERTGVVDQIRIDVMSVRGDGDERLPVTQIMYKVNFTTGVETILESAL